MGIILALVKLSFVTHTRAPYTEWYTHSAVSVRANCSVSIHTAGEFGVFVRDYSDLVAATSLYNFHYMWAMVMGAICRRYRGTCGQRCPSAFAYSFEFANSNNNNNSDRSKIYKTFYEYQSNGR